MDLAKLVQLCKDMGYEGQALQDLVKEQQAQERDERAATRVAEREAEQSRAEREAAARLAEQEKAQLEAEAGRKEPELQIQ